MPSHSSPTGAAARPSRAVLNIATTARPPPPPLTQSSLWEFSQAIYALPGVSTACLKLQDANGADVNLLLFALWAASRGEAFGEPEMIAAEHATRAWREIVVKPLRAVRRQLRAIDIQGALGLRKMVGAAELEAERLQQETLAATVARPASNLPKHDLARANLAACAARLHPPPDPARLAPLLTAFAHVAT